VPYRECQLRPQREPEQIGLVTRVSAGEYRQAESGGRPSDGEHPAAAERTEGRVAERHGDAEENQRDLVADPAKHDGHASNDGVRAGETDEPGAATHLAAAVREAGVAQRSQDQCAEGREQDRPRLNHRGGVTNLVPKRERQVQRGEDAQEARQLTDSLPAGRPEGQLPEHQHRGAYRKPWPASPDQDCRRGGAGDDEEGHRCGRQRAGEQRRCQRPADPQTGNGGGVPANCNGCPQRPDGQG
jgi:hypothetical protein